MIPEKNILYVWQGRILYAGATGYAAEPHRHYAASLLIAPEEPLLLNVDGRSSRPRCVLLRPNLYHQSISQARVLVLQLDPDSALYEPMGRWLGSDGYREIPYESVASFEHRFSELFLEMLDCREADRLYCDVIRQIWGADPRQAPRIQARIARLIEELKADLPEQISVSDLAARVGLSEDRFMHVFKDEMGLPVRRYVLWLRLHRAARMMKSGVTLTEAAHAAGFSDSAHMSRTFKDNFGVSPSGFLSPARQNLRIRICAEA
ncbi:MAG: AraC family transcriptional regulator [bacterium]|nr:AraC family transcriptional regulator [bacterium]